MEFDVITNGVYAYRILRPLVVTSYKGTSANKNYHFPIKPVNKKAWIDVSSPRFQYFQSIPYMGVTEPCLKPLISPTHQRCGGFLKACDTILSKAAGHLSPKGSSIAARPLEGRQGKRSVRTQQSPALMRQPASQA